MQIRALVLSFFFKNLKATFLILQAKDLEPETRSEHLFFWLSPLLHSSLRIYNMVPINTCGEVPPPIVHLKKEHKANGLFILFREKRWKRKMMGYLFQIREMERQVNNNSTLLVLAHFAHHLISCQHSHFSLSLLHSAASVSLQFHDTSRIDLPSSFWEKLYYLKLLPTHSYSFSLCLISFPSTHFPPFPLSK